MNFNPFLFDEFYYILPNGLGGCHVTKKNKAMAIRALSMCPDGTVVTRIERYKLIRYKKNNGKWEPF